jgi:hypothetical protein
MAGWLPDDRRILIFSGKSLYIVSADSGEFHKVADLDSDISFAKLSTDGRSLYVQRTISQSDIWMATLK